MQKIIYTKTDEAPALATLSLLPIIQAYAHTAGIIIESKDISLASRIIANFPDANVQQQSSDALAEIGRMVKKPQTNIIKLPNISASIPQLKSAIKELQALGYAVPNYPEVADSDETIHIKARYAKILGSAVNPVLREGNSDRRVALPVKVYAQKHPHNMGTWLPDSKSHITSMNDGDFYSSEQSYISKTGGHIKIELLANNGKTYMFKQKIPLLSGEIIDAAVMSRKDLCAFFEKSIVDAKAEDVLLSLHLKATMMKVSDPIIFGHAVKIYYQDVFAKHAKVFAQLGIDARNGLSDIYSKISVLKDNLRQLIKADLQDACRFRPQLAMVNSEKGITNLHIPSDIIIDASIPAVVRAGGKMWGADGKLHDTKAMIPDRCYAAIYDEVFKFCQEHGAFEVTTMGSVSNIGLMAQKAEEYGSHDKTFEIPAKGEVRVVDDMGNILLAHKVEQGDIWRMCQTKDLPIQDWVKLALNRTKLTGDMAIFWLDKNRAHDANLIAKIKNYLKQYDTSGLKIKIMSPAEAMRTTLQRVKAGKNTISITGNVLRDYLTDLFPILELGTSAKMLSIVPLLAGGKLFETGAGGSAPKHAHQLIEENHLRWDSLGEFLALAVSLEDLAEKTQNKKAQILVTALNLAINQVLNNNKSPKYKVFELDTRGSHFYLALYWARALAIQSTDKDLQVKFISIEKQLDDNADKIVQELNFVQGKAVDIGGYYYPNQKLSCKVMRPSKIFNEIIDAIK